MEGLLVDERKRDLFREAMVTMGIKHRERFPWLIDRTPYRILVAEVLLARTGTERVARVFGAFVSAFPTLGALADASPQRIKSVIKSLGIHYRANRMKTIAERVVSEFRGAIPDDPDLLAEFKGIGRYSANAIACFGHGKRHPIVDGNIVRILRRVFGAIPRIKTARSDKGIWALAEELLPEEHFVDYNYGLLHFGTLVCMPKKTRCLVCSLAEVCVERTARSGYAITMYLKK